ncbi:MAG: DNA-binding protein [Candidatus Micrarchaeota archaeon]
MPEQNEEQKGSNEREEAKKVEEKINGLLRAALTEDAYSRITNVKVANKDLYFGAAKNIITIYKRIERQINDEELKQILKTLLSEKERQPTITFNRK